MGSFRSVHQWSVAAQPATLLEPAPAGLAPSRQRPSWERRVPAPQGQSTHRHRVRAERAVQVIELLAAGGGDGDGQARYLPPPLARSSMVLASKLGVELLGDVRDRGHEAVSVDADHLDREGAGVVDQRFARRSGREFDRLRRRRACRRGVMGGGSWSWGKQRLLGALVDNVKLLVPGRAGRGRPAGRPSVVMGSTSLVAEDSSNSSAASTSARAMRRSSKPMPSCAHSSAMAP